MTEFQALGDRQWDIIVGEVARRGGQSSVRNGRAFMNAFHYVMTSGQPWRDMDPQFGKWNSVYVRARRWAFDGLLDHVVHGFHRAGLTDRWQPLSDPVRTTGWTQTSKDEGGVLRNAVYDLALALRADPPREALSIKRQLEAGAAMRSGDADPEAPQLTARNVGGLGKGASIIIQVRLPFDLVDVLDAFVEEQKLATRRKGLEVIVTKHLQALRPKQDDPL
jgi:transposase